MVQSFTRATLEEARPLIERAQKDLLTPPNDPQGQTNRDERELSDILCFHDYGALPGLKTQVASLLAKGRPVMCTEWMARTQGSLFATHLPFFKENKIACWNWGFVAGRTQTYFPWGSPFTIVFSSAGPLHPSVRAVTPFAGHLPLFLSGFVGSCGVIIVGMFGM